MLRVNPISAIIWWLLWNVPLAIGFWMFVRDEGLAWQRTEKIDANKLLIREKLQSAGAPLEIGPDQDERTTLISQSKESNLG
jgi:hypothetical protein